MFKGPKFITRGVKENIPPFMQNILWYLIETMEVKEKDYLQVFQLGSVMVDGKRKQTITHSQQQPEYRTDYTVCAKQIVLEKIFVIDDLTHCTMLLAEEY
ncbi:DUF960 family protein [Paenibacillus sp. TC-CSREp1]|uniref:DUF960 family protein n=1 Tax=Paenibacillus sp. TC-CSREp1 TaxID=3410089 RepID=UPI003D02017C